MTDIGTSLKEASRSVSPEQPAFERLVRRRDRKARNRRIASTVVALAVVAGVLGVTLSALGGLFAGGRASIRPGDDAPSDPRLVLEPGEYFYERSVLIVPDGVEGMTGGTVNLESWWALDGSGRFRAESDTPSYRPRESGTWGPAEFPADSSIENLSRDPETLMAELLGRSRPDGASPQPEPTPGTGMTAESGRVWRAVEALLEMPNAVPELRAALFVVAGELEGVEALRGAVDPVGREAVALGISTPGGGRIQLFFDPGTRQFLGSKETYSEGTWHHIVLEAGIVGSTQETPRAGERFFAGPLTPVPTP